MDRPDLALVSHAIALANHFLGLGAAEDGNRTRVQKTLKGHGFPSRLYFLSNVYLTTGDLRLPPVFYQHISAGPKGNPEYGQLNNYDEVGCAIQDTVRFYSRGCIFLGVT
jgi:hypothetical protein